MAKIVRIVTRLNIGGPAIHTILLSRGMTSAGYQTVLVAGACEPDDGDMSYLVQQHDCIRWVPEMSRSVNPWRNLRALYHLVRLIRSERPLIVHTHTAMAGTLGRLAALICGVPIIVHTFHGNSLRHYFSPLASRFFLYVERALARVSDAICVVAPQQLEELSQHFRIAARDKFRVVPLGLPLEPYLSIPEPPASPPPLVVGWFGRLVPVKNVPLLLAVAEEVLRRTDEVVFLVAGDGPERRALQQPAERFRGRIVWLGWQRDLTPLLARCHLLLQTSLNEGTPLALIQGMAAGRPFLSTPVGGVLDMVSGPVLRNGAGCCWFANAVLAEASPEAFAHALIEFSRNPAIIADMGLKAREFACAHYRQEALVHNLASLYQELISRKASGGRIG